MGVIKDPGSPPAYVSRFHKQCYAPTNTKCGALSIPIISPASPFFKHILHGILSVLSVVDRSDVSQRVNGQCSSSMAALAGAGMISRKWRTKVEIYVLLCLLPDLGRLRKG